MGLGRLFRHDQPERRDQSFWALPGGYGISTTTGSYSYAGGSTEQALRNAASWCAINILADNIGRTPIDVFRGTGSDRRPVEPQPKMIASPSGIVLPDVWRAQLGWSLATDGNAFGLITSWTRQMWPDSVELLDPCDVTDREVVAGVPQVKIGTNRETHKLFPHGDIWHVPGKSVTPGSPFGLSPVKYANASIRTSLAAEQFSSSYFDNGGLPAAIIYAESDINADQASQIKQAFAAATANTRSPAVLGSDLKLETIKVDPAESQFLDLIRFEVEQAARFWGVPPSMLYGAVSGQAVTYANITDADLNFLKHSLDGYYVRIESALTDALPRPQVVKVNRNAILRATPKDRYDLYALALGNKLMTINEVRALEDLPKFNDPEFDKPGVPVGAATAEGDIERQALILQKMYLAVGVILTPDEAREMARKAGIDLPASYDPALLGKRPASQSQ